MSDIDEEYAYVNRRGQPRVVFMVGCELFTLPPDRLRERCAEWLQLCDRSEALAAAEKEKP